MVFLSGWTSGRQEPRGKSEDLARCGTGMVAFHVDSPVSRTGHSGQNLSSGAALSALVRQNPPPNHSAGRTVSPQRIVVLSSKMAIRRRIKALARN